MKSFAVVALLGAAQNQYASAQGTADFLAETGQTPDGGTKYVMNWDVARYPNVIGVHPGDQVTLTYHTMHNVYQLPDSESFDTCNTSKGFQLDTSPVPYPADGPFAAGDPEPRVSYTYNVPQAQDSTPVYLACAASGHCEAGQEISLAIIPEYAELNPDDSGLLSRALSMAWNLTTNYGSGWFYVIPNDQILMVYPATDDVYKMPDQSAWDACDFTKAERVDVGSARIPYKDIVTNQERAAYMLSSQEEDKVYIASQANGNCGKGMKVRFSFQNPGTFAAEPTFVSMTSPAPTEMSSAEAVTTATGTAKASLAAATAAATAMAVAVALVTMVTML